MARKILLTSGKGGVGKTTVCCNLAVQLARRGCRVILCDLDLGLNNADIALGLENRAAYGLLDAVEGKCRARQTLVKHPRYPTLFTISSSRTGEDYLSAQAVRLILDSLSPQFDFILLDSPAGVGEGFRRAAACSEEAILVTTPHLASMRDADTALGRLIDYRLSVLGIVVNQVRRDLMRRGDVLTEGEISAALRLPVLASVPADDTIFLESVSERSRAFRALADAVLRAGAQGARKDA